MGDYKYDVFVSHNSKDKELVGKLVDKLKETDSNLRIWMDQDDLPPGQDWLPRLAQGIHESAAVIVCVGKHGMGRYAKTETQMAMEDEDASKPVIPVMLRGGPDIRHLPPELKIKTALDLRDGLDGPGFAKLIKSMQQPKPISEEVKEATARYLRGCESAPEDLLEIIEGLKGNENVRKLAARIRSMYKSRHLLPSWTLLLPIITGTLALTLILAYFLSTP